MHLARWYGIRRMWVLTAPMIVGYFFFVPFVLLHPTKPSDTTIVLALAIVVAGTLLVWVVIRDTANRALGKHKLAAHLAVLSQREMDYFTWMVVRPGELGAMPRPVPFDQVERNLKDDGLPPWSQLISFLERDRVGMLAADALFQRSRIGRTRYLDSVLGLGALRRAERAPH